MVSRWLKPCFYIAVHRPLMLALPFTAAPVKDVKDAQAYNDLTKDEDGDGMGHGTSRGASQMPL